MFQFELWEKLQYIYSWCILDAFSLELLFHDTNRPLTDKINFMSQLRKCKLNDNQKGQVTVISHDGPMVQVELVDIIGFARIAPGRCLQACVFAVVY